MNNKIHQRGRFEAIELPAASAISPGMLVEETSAGKLQPHSTAGGFGEVIVAQEDALQGRIVTDAYAADEPVNAYIYQRGCIGMAVLLAGSNYTVGTKLISDGAGRLKPTTGSPTKHFATVITALDLSASGAASTLGQVRYH
jgi:hypothetical protein